MDQFFKEHWGDLASVMGLLVSIVGFVIAVEQIRSSRRAAEQARDAAAEVRSRFRDLDILAAFTEVLGVLAEIKRLHRANAWNTVVDRYATARRLLVAISHMLRDGKYYDGEEVSMAVHQLLILEPRVERALATSKSPPSISNTNAILSKMEDDLAVVMAVVRTKLENPNG